MPYYRPPARGFQQAAWIPAVTYTMSGQRITKRLTLSIAAALVVIVSSYTPSAAAASSPGFGSSQRATPAPLGAANSRLRREVFGFVNSSKLGDNAVGYPSWNFSLLSTVAFFRLQVNSGNGYIVPAPDAGWNTFHSSTMTNFVSTAHAYGTRVIVSINLHDMSTSPTNQVCTGLLSANYTNTINESLQLVHDAGIDGVALNYEATNVNCDTTPAPTEPVTSRDRFTNFVAAFRKAMPTGYINVPTFSGSAEDNLEFFNVTGLAPNIDSFFVMAYDMDWANYAEVPLNCSSYCFNPVSPLNTYRFNVTKSMQQYTALVPAGKVILGQPYYGSRGCVAGPGPAHQKLLSNYVNTTYIYASTIASQTGVSSLSKNRDPSDGNSEWDTWWDSDWGCWREQYFDDVQSLGVKYDVVNQMNLRGVGFFTLDYGGGSPELWNELDGKFATSTPWYTVGGVASSGPDASSWGATRTDVFVRGTDNAIWHRPFNGTNWGAWESLGGVATSDPTAVSWGPNRIDFFVRGTDRGIWHRWSDGTTWSGWESLGGIATSAPDAASWGPNRLDVFVTGTDHNGLWQATWNGTSWGWTSIGGIATSDPGAVSSGGNHLDVFLRGTDQGLWQASWNGTAWGWTALGGVLTSAPDASSCAAGHLDVFMTGTDRGLWQRGYNGTSWGGWTAMRGQWTTSPGAVCPTGTTSASVFERGPDTALWQTSVPAT